MLLKGERVAALPLDVEAHGEELFAASHGEAASDMFFHLPFGPFNSLPNYKTHLEEWRGDGDIVAHVFEDRKHAALFGSASFMRIRSAHRSLEIGYVWFTPAYRRSVFATEAIFLLLDHVFEGLGYRRCEWKCDIRNTASRSAAERLGFQVEGIFRNDMIVKGRNRDTAWYSITDDRWPPLRLALRRWLSSENFDTEGRQRRRLADLR